MQGYRTHIKLTEYKLRSRNNRIVPAPRRRPVDWWAVLGLALMASSAACVTFIALAI